MTQIIIGKEGNQPFDIPDPNVSRRHAIVNVNEMTGQLMLVDCNSTNGTYIYDGSRFVRLFPQQPYPVTYDTMIQLGPNTRFHVRKLFQQKPKPKEEPKPVDISSLRDISNHYNEEKIDIESKMGNVNSLRSCTLLVSVIAVGGGKILTQSAFGTENQTLSWMASILLGVILLGMLLYFIKRYNEKLIYRRNKNENDYALKYSCPKCKMPFRGKMYENILAEGHCPKCKTKFYDKRQS